MNLFTWNVIGILALMVALCVLIWLMSNRCADLEYRLACSNRSYNDVCETANVYFQEIRKWKGLFGGGPGLFTGPRSNHDDNDKTVAIDLDGVILEYVSPWNGVFHFGDPIPGAAEAMEKIRKLGYRISIYTTRNNIMAECNRGWDSVTLTNMVREQLDKHGIPYDHIALFKPMARYYIDDRAIRFVDWEDTLNQLARHEKDRLEDRSDEIMGALYTFSEDAQDEEDDE